MTLSEARLDVTRLNSVLLEVGLAQSVNPAIPMQVGDRVRLSWPNAKFGRGGFSEQPFASISEYLYYLTGNHYTCLLADGGLLQISVDFRNAVMVSQRFCFYPCPLVLPDRSYAADIDALVDLLEEELFDEIDKLSANNGPARPEPAGRARGLIRLRSPIRFDFDPDNEAANEPASHVHLNDGNVRVPVYAALSLGHFVQFVIRHFYPAYRPVLDRFPVRHHDRCIQYSDEELLHINLRRTI